MTDCEITGNLTANDVQSVALKTVNADGSGSAVSCSDMQDKNNPYYLLADAIALMEFGFVNN